MNIVFDLGGVVLRWKPRELVAAHFPDAAQQEKVFEQAYRHSDWLALDRGTLSQAQAVENAARRTGCSRDALNAFYTAVPDFLQPIPATLALMQALRDDGVPLYVLSNMHENSINALEKAHGFFDMFEGGVISCRVKLIKPEAAIYRNLLDAYALKAAETVFVDDMPENVEAARSLGMHGIVFTDAAACNAEFQRLGIFAGG